MPQVSTLPTMKTFHLSALILAAALPGAAIFAQDKTAPAPVAVSPAPSPAAVPINGFVYVEKLPTPTQLISEAEAEHLTILRMEQTASRIVVVYQYTNGTTRAFAYTTSTPTSNDQVQIVAPASTASYMISSPSTPPPTVVYAQPNVVYYDSYPRYVQYYDPAWDFWAPLAVGVGLGWGFGWHGGYHGGYYGGHGGGHGGHH
jgi:hypothetical protein